MNTRTGLFTLVFAGLLSPFSLHAQETPPVTDQPATEKKDGASPVQTSAPPATTTSATVQPQVTKVRPKLAGPRRPPQSGVAFSRGSSEVRKAYSGVASKALDATVRIFNGKDRAALGTVIAADGLVLTKASEVHADIECELPDGTKTPAKVVGIIQEHDLALLRLDLSKAPGQLAFVSLYEGNTPAVGTLLASPNPDFEPAAVGVLSAAPRLVPKQAGRMGINLSQEIDGPARIEAVIPNGPAVRAKIAAGDIITSVQGVEVKSQVELKAQLQKYEPGDTVKVTVRRGDATLDFTVTLGGDAMFAEVLGRGANREEFQNRLGGDLSRRRVGFKSVIQHDTVLIPSDCGGPVVDLDGNVIGINIARAGRVASYAIPAGVIRAMLPDLIAGKFAPRSDVDQQLQKLAQVEDELLKKISALRNILSGEPDEEDESEKAKPVEAILPDDEKMKIESQISELETQLAKIRADLLQLESKKAGGAPTPTSTNM